MSIRGRVQASDGQPLAEARVYYEHAPVPVPDIAALADAAGRFNLATPAAGTYTIGATMDGYAPSSVTVDVGAQEQADVEITLEADGP
jgi:hypothetical protein